MKQLIIWVIAATLLVGTSCNDEKTIRGDELPDAASTFISMHFSGAVIAHAEKEKEGLFGSEFKVHLNDGTELDFDNDGNWISVDGAGNEPIPTGFIPDAITNHVSATFPDAAISDISRKKNGFDVDLTNGMDLEFDSDGHFVRVD